MVGTPDRVVRRWHLEVGKVNRAIRRNRKLDVLSGLVVTFGLAGQWLEREFPDERGDVGIRYHVTTEGGLMPAVAAPIRLADLDRQESVHIPHRIGRQWHADRRPLR